jgi:RpiR family carbohydrate utilization transcriptional regulator
MQRIDILKRLRASTLSLSTAEQRVANFCLSDPRAFSKLPVALIAEKSHVSKPTVVRFCRSAGFEGLADFKRKLTHAVEDCVPYIHQSVGENEKPVNVSYKLIDNVVTTMLSFRDSVRPDLIEVVIKRLLETHRGGGRVLLMGIGASALAAQDAMVKLYRLGVNVQCFTECHDQFMAASLARECDTFVIFSNSGRTREAIEACEIANKRSATTVVVTATNTPLSFIGKYRIASDNSEAYENFSPMLSRIQQLVLVDILVTCFAIAMGTSEIEERLQECSRNLETRRFGRNTFA